MTQSSFYSDTPNYAASYPTQNDSNTQPLNGNTQSPSSFYQNGADYAQADPAAAANSASAAAVSATSAASSLATLLSALVNYVTSSSLVTTLSSYVTSSSLVTTLSSYVTSAGLVSTLSFYASINSPALTGTPTAPTAAALSNNGQLANTAYVDAAAALKAPLASPAFTSVPTAPTAPAGTTNTQLSTTAFAAQAVANAQNFKNIVGRNGGMEVWQRLVGGATTIAVPASTVAYTVDGWYLQSQAAAASTVTQVAGLTNNSRYAAKVQRNSGQTGAGAYAFAFPLDTDELNKLRGNSVVLSFTVKAGANWSPASGALNYYLMVGTGAPTKRGNIAVYTGETQPIGGSGVNLTPGGASVRVVSTISGAVPTNINQAELLFFWTTTGTAGADDSFTIDDVQIEVVPTGTTAVTPLFERSDYIWDLQRCQRFLPAYNASDSSVRNLAFGGTVTTSLSFHSIPFRVSARAAPTGVVVSSPGHFYSTQANGTTTTATALTFNTSTTESCFVTVTVAGTPFTIGQASAIGSQSASAQILFTGAEI